MMEQREEYSGEEGVMEKARGKELEKIIGLHEVTGRVGPL